MEVRVLSWAPGLRRGAAPAAPTHRTCLVRQVSHDFRWPAGAGYVAGYPKLRTAGLARVAIDNSANDHSLFLKLFALDGDGTGPVRQIYIPAHGSYTMSEVSPGRYDVRYQNLSDRSLAKTDGFVIESNSAGVKLTLYNVPNGNLGTRQIDPREFENVR